MARHPNAPALAQSGFTLVEVSVVVLVIGLLIAIVIPTFLGAQQRAQDRVAQSGLRNGLSTAKVLFTDGETYATADAASLNAAEPAIHFVENVALRKSDIPTRDVSVQEDETSWGAAALSDSETCFYILDPGDGPVRYGSAPVVGNNCRGSKATVANTPSTNGW